jgi:hypothetical protein
MQLSRPGIRFIPYEPCVGSRAATGRLSAFHVERDPFAEQPYTGDARPRPGSRTPPVVRGPGPRPRCRRGHAAAVAGSARIAVLVADPVAPTNPYCWRQWRTEVSEPEHRDRRSERRRRGYPEPPLPIAVSGDPRPLSGPAPRHLGIGRAVLVDVADAGLCSHVDIRICPVFARNA